MTSWLPLAAGLPVVFALLTAWRSSRTVGLLLAPAAAWPVLALAILAPPGEVYTPWLMLGATLGLDQTGRVFLFFTALLWSLAGLYARSYVARDPRRHAFWIFFLLTMSGNLGLTIALDVVSFYLFFALMTLSAYGLVVHDRSPGAYRAGRVYIVMAVAGEACLLAGLLLAAQAAGLLYLPAVPSAVAASPQRDLTVGLLLAGFGIKAGALPLHVWLPLAHPVAPTPASAVLSGCMIKAGLLGWLRFLPAGHAEMPGWGALILLLGLGAAFFGVVAGMTQRDPKTALAYSSISQMGLMNAGFGIGLAAPKAWPVVLPGILVFALHHALAKGSLFLGVGLAASDRGGRGRRALLTAGLILPALALAGAPFTSGAVAKSLMKGAANLAPLPWLDGLLSLSSVGTGLLMGRFLLLTLPVTTGETRHRLGPAAWGSWTVLLAGVAAASWVLPPAWEIEAARPPLAPGYIWPGLWPVLLAILLLAAGRRLIRRPFAIAPGDMLAPVERALEPVRRAWRRRTEPPESFATAWHRVIYGWIRRGPAAVLERRLARWETAGTALLLLVAAMLGVLWLGGR
jgi:formate hydrogenlyase subunit 3/multisubunit Na+/H+ antiporter MnhD subunit